jgi:hypothetical protein
MKSQTEEGLHVFVRTNFVRTKRTVAILSKEVEQKKFFCFFSSFLSFHFWPKNLGTKISKLSVMKILIKVSETPKNHIRSEKSQVGVLSQRFFAISSSQNAKQTDLSIIAPSQISSTYPYTYICRYISSK